MSVFSRSLTALAVTGALWPSAVPAEDAPKPAPAAKPAITKVSCENLKVSVAWSGSGVAVVDYYAAGSPVLQKRQDPSANQSSIDVELDKGWEGRKVDVRIWDQDIKLLDTKSTECKAKT